MDQVIGGFTCPKGHVSTEPDYCSECGAKIQGKAASGADAGNGAGATAAAQVCPDCGTVREGGGSAFCEVCGYNFNTSAHGEIAMPAAAAPEAAVTVPLEGEAKDSTDAQAAVATAPLQWSVEVSVDPALRGAESPAAPLDVPPFTVVLGQPVSLIGRLNEARAIFPEIALPFDEAVSRRHALLQIDDAGHLSVRDIGAANGTRLNGVDLQSMKDYPLGDGDQIALGHWTKIVVHAIA